MAFRAPPPRSVLPQACHKATFLGSTQGRGPGRPFRWPDPWGAVIRSAVTGGDGLSSSLRSITQASGRRKRKEAGADGGWVWTPGQVWTGLDTWAGVDWVWAPGQVGAGLGHLGRWGLGVGTWAGVEGGCAWARGG